MGRIVTCPKLAISLKFISILYVEEIMSNLPWWLSLIVKILIVDSDKKPDGAQQ